MMKENSTHYLEAWDLAVEDTGWTRSTRTSTVTKVRDQSQSICVLKHLNDIGKLDEADGGLLLKWYDGEGAVQLLRSDENAHLLEYAGEIELKDKIVADPSFDKEATAIFLNIASQLHAKRPTPTPELSGLRPRFQELYNKAAKEGPQSIFGWAATTANKLLETTSPADTIPLHGDLHHENILLGDRGWLAIDPKGLTGDRHYDVANLFCNPDDMEELIVSKARIQWLAEQCIDKLSMDYHRTLGFALVHATLSASWSILEERHDNAQRRLRVAKTIQGILS